MLEIIEFGVMEAVRVDVLEENNLVRNWISITFPIPKDRIQAGHATMFPGPEFSKHRSLKYLKKTGVQIKYKYDEYPNDMFDD